MISKVKDIMNIWKCQAKKRSVFLIDAIDDVRKITPKGQLVDLFRTRNIEFDLSLENLQLYLNESKLNYSFAAN